MMSAKGKLITGITAGVLIVGGVAFGFRDQFLSDKSLYLKIEKENIGMIADKLDDVKKEDLLGMFFAENSNKSKINTDVSLNISADGIGSEIANFFNSLKLSIINEEIQKEEYKNKKIALSYKEDELVDLNIVNDIDNLGISIPKLYDKWIVTDMSIGEFIAELAKSEEATGTTNPMSVNEVKSALTLSKTQKQDFNNALNYHFDKVKKTLNNVKFTKVSDDSFLYNDDNEVIVDSIKLELSEVETLARLSQVLIKAKENGQIIDLFYDKVTDIKEVHGNNNILTDYIPEKQEIINKINDLLTKIDDRLEELGVTDTSILFDEEDKYIGIEDEEERYYSMVIYYDNDYKILKRVIYAPDSEDVIYEIICVENSDERFYMVKTPNVVYKDSVEIDGGIAIHKLSKSYYKESYSFENFKLVKVPKWVENEEILTIKVDSSDNQKIISFEIPSIDSVRFFVDIQKEEISRNEIDVITKVGLELKDKKQYMIFDKNILKKADIEKTDINSNSININEETQEKVNMIADVIKGNTSGLSQAIKEKTGIDLTETFENIKSISEKAIYTYKTATSLGLIGK